MARAERSWRGIDLKHSLSMRAAWLVLCWCAVWCGGPAQAAASGAVALAQAAQRQVGITLHYDGAYRTLSYPGGDVPIDRGVCTDVVVRAYRYFGVDLQKLVHDDMRQAWSAYPRTWGNQRPDPNIDHRRVPNLATFFERKGALLPVTQEAADYRPGDLVTWRLPSGVPHIGIVATERTRDGVPLIIHNIGRGARIEDALFAYTITGHFRYLPRALQAGADDGVR